MFLKQEKPEMGDFERIKTLILIKGKVLKNNILRKYFEKCFNGYPCKNPLRMHFLKSSLKEAAKKFKLP